jgi:hypothetical protein
MKLEQMATEKLKNHKEKGNWSPVESPILFQDKSVSADTNRSP